ncbi:sulfotransferase [Thalassobaculum sp.]|uniref:tetratricopeptide repeat-containing sulfotransferase family protein n=1 Tax=Thalassobaculum sp. TaxID=2022740 RepID=UPI0032EF18EB
MTARRLSPKILSAVDRAVSTGDPAPARPHHHALMAATDLPAGVLYRLAMLEARSGAADTAIRLLEAARAGGPANPDLLVNLAQLKLGRDDPAGAYECLCGLPASARAHPVVARLEGDALAGLGRHAEAVATYQTGLRRAPYDAALHANLGVACRALGRLREAAHHLETALARAPTVEARVNLAGLLVDLDQADRAVELLARGLADTPGVGLLHRHLAFAARADGDALLANAAARRALLLVPADVSATATVAELADNRADLPEAARWVGRARVLDPRHVTSAQLAVRLARRLKRFDEALTVADGWLAAETMPARRYPVLFERAQASEADGDAVAAFAAFEAANAAQAIAAPGALDPGHAFRQLAELDRLYAAAQPTAAMPASSPDDGPSPVFLVGFPRSGTTLLDQVLDAHPEIAVVEERPFIAGLIARFSVAGRSYPEALTTLSDADRAEMRAWYRARMKRFLPDAPTRYVVDKMPLNLVHAGLIRSVFPEARFLLALRHPCDVVLSCFMQNFHLNTWMASFTTLDGAAGLYRAALGVWETYAGVFDPPRITVRYEDLVDDLPREAARVLRFLDLPWDDGVTRFHEHARSRGVLATPSAAQVTQPVYRTALARWRRYDFAMTPIAGTLAEEIRRYGYDDQEEHQ